jgi:hypothetical protein
MKFSLRIATLVIAGGGGVLDYVGVVFGAEINNTDIMNHAEGEKLGIVYQDNTINIGCDESKCVSTGLSWQLFNDSFTCYAGGEYYRAMMCADGYKPNIVVNETTIYYGGYEFQYFTCCPPNPSSNVIVSCHCSNSTSVDNGCDDTTKPYHHEMKTSSSNKPYPRQMKTRKSLYDDDVESYVCCDYNTPNENENGNHNTNFLDEIEWVPYNDKFYEQYAVYNYYGNIRTAICDEPESGFKFPKYVEYNNTNSSAHPFECCRAEEGSTPFYQDYNFKITVYPQIAISALAVISSMVLIIALLIPLLVPLLTNLRKQSTDNTGIKELVYSSYSLYLVYSAIPDLMLNLYLLTMYGSYANQTFNPTHYGIIVTKTLVDHSILIDYGSNFEGAFIVACSTANLVRILLIFNSIFAFLYNINYSNTNFLLFLFFSFKYLNCVVSHEILILLRNCHQAIQCDPPGLLKVTLQASAVYMFSMIVFTVHFFTGIAATRSENEDDDDYNSYKLNFANLIWSLLVTYAFPILFLIYVWISIKCRGYMQSATGRMQELVIRSYFTFTFLTVSF